MRDLRRALIVALTVGFRTDRRRATGVLVLSTVAALAGVLGAYWLNRIVDAAVAGGGTAAVLVAAGIGLTTGLAAMAGASTTRMQFPLKEHIGMHLGAGCHDELMAANGLYAELYDCRRGSTASGHACRRPI